MGSAVRAGLAGGVNAVVAAGARGAGGLGERFEARAHVRPHAYAVPTAVADIGADGGAAGRADPTGLARAVEVGRVANAVLADGAKLGSRVECRVSGRIA